MALGVTRSRVVAANSHSPLTPAVLHILLALATEERHGYGIMKQVEADSQGKVTMGLGILYGSLGRMLEAGLIRERRQAGKGVFSLVLWTLGETFVAIIRENATRIRRGTMTQDSTHFLKTVRYSAIAVGILYGGWHIDLDGPRAWHRRRHHGHRGAGIAGNDRVWRRGHHGGRASKARAKGVTRRLAAPGLRV